MPSPLRALVLGLLVVSVLIGCASDEASLESSAGEEDLDQPTSTSTTIDRVDREENQPDSWPAFGEWEAPTTLAVNGSVLGPLVTIHECFADECGTPLDYWRTQDFVVAAGTEIQVRSGASVQLLPTVRRLSDDLAFETLSGQSAGVGAVSIVLNTPGLHHVDVRGDIGFDEVDGLNRFRHFLWVQVVDDSAPCMEDNGATSSLVTGVVDAAGCPVESSTLNIDSLHPDFHCAPWPATLTLGSRPGLVYARTGFDERSIDIVAAPPVDLEPTGVFIESGEVLLADSDPDAAYVENTNGEIERWGPDDDVGCA